MLHVSPLETAYDAVMSQVDCDGSRTSSLRFTGWRTRLAEKWDSLSAVVRIAMVGKYTGLSDAYLSVLKALQHACLSASRKLEVLWVEAGHLEPVAEVPSHISLAFDAAC